MSHVCILSQVLHMMRCRKRCMSFAVSYASSSLLSSHHLASYPPIIPLSYPPITFLVSSSAYRLPRIVRVSSSSYHHVSYPLVSHPLCHAFWGSVFCRESRILCLLPWVMLMLMPCVMQCRVVCIRTRCVCVCVMMCVCVSNAVLCVFVFVYILYIRFIIIFLYIIILYNISQL